MTDRELLELAAKAAGYEWKWDQPRGSDRGWLRIREGDRWPMWRPYVDDGDALRLAVMLGLYLEIDRPNQRASALPESENMGFSRERFGSDPCAATRRAIVRAAAAIGKAMP